MIKSSKKTSSSSSIIIALESDMNVSRRNWIVNENQFHHTSKIKTIICWMEKTPMDSSSLYRLQHEVKLVKSKIKPIDSKLNAMNIEKKEATDIRVNGLLGWATIQLAYPLHFNYDDESKETEAFVLIAIKNQYHYR